MIITYVIAIINLLLPNTTFNHLPRSDRHILRYQQHHHCSLVQAYPSCWLLFTSYMISPGIAATVGRHSSVFNTTSSHTHHALRDFHRYYDQVTNAPDPLPPPFRDDSFTQTSSPIPKINLSTSEPTRSADVILFDTDTAMLFLDSCVTGAVTPFIDDISTGTFIPNRDSNNVIHGSGGIFQNTGTGTATYTIRDDNGFPFTLRIPNTVVSPQVSYRLCAPQYMARLETERFPNEDFQLGMFTKEDVSFLYFDKGRRRKTIPHIQGCEVPAMSVNPENSQFHKYHIAMNLLDGGQLKSNCQPTRNI